MAWLAGSVHGVVVQITANSPGVAVAGKALHVNYSFVWMSAAGTAILLAAILTAILLRLPFKTFLRVAKETYIELRNPIIAIAAIVGFANK